MLTVRPIPAFIDNYIWLLSADGVAWVVDPGEAAPVQALLQQEGLRLGGILLTHHHPDHVGGAAALRAAAPIPVYGPALERERMPQITHGVSDGDVIALDGVGLELQILEVPGHTRGHIAYQGGGCLFCGDTLFAAGCGRLFEGTPAQMQASLARLAALGDETRVYCGHEYTVANLQFAQAVEPENEDVRQALAAASACRQQGRPTLPTTLDQERRVNPFLRCHLPAVAQAMGLPPAAGPEERVAVFAALRRQKDGFRAPTRVDKI